jgi:hypothetical protein
MAKLTAAARKKISSKNFALPGGRYPVNDAAHARNALARASQHASPAEQATIKRKVRAKYPSIAVTGLKKKGLVSERAEERGKERYERTEQKEY